MDDSFSHDRIQFPDLVFTISHHTLYYTPLYGGCFAQREIILPVSDQAVFLHPAQFQQVLPLAVPQQGFLPPASALP